MIEFPDDLLQATLPAPFLRSQLLLRRWELGFRPLALGDDRHGGAARLPVLGSGSLDVCPKRVIGLVPKRQLAGLFRRTLKYSLQEGVEGGTGISESACFLRREPYNNGAGER